MEAATEEVAKVRGWREQGEEMRSRPRHYLKTVMAREGKAEATEVADLKGAEVEEAGHWRELTTLMDCLTPHILEPGNQT